MPIATARPNKDFRMVLTTRHNCRFRLEGNDTYLTWTHEHDTCYVMPDYQNEAHQHHWKWVRYKRSVEIPLDWIDGGSPDSIKPQA